MSFCTQKLYIYKKREKILRAITDRRYYYRRDVMIFSSKREQTPKIRWRQILFSRRRFRRVAQHARERGYFFSRKEFRRRDPKNDNEKWVRDFSDADLAIPTTHVPLSSSMLPPPLIDRRKSFFGTTFPPPRWWFRRETVRNASRAAALNMRESSLCPLYVSFALRFESGANLTRFSFFLSFFFGSKKRNFYRKNKRQ